MGSASADGGSANHRVWECALSEMLTSSPSICMWKAGVGDCLVSLDTMHDLGSGHGCRLEFLSIATASGNFSSGTTKSIP